MPKYRKITTSFRAGEWSPLLLGRTDLKDYYAACKKLRNMIAYPHGVVTKRPGTYYISTAANTEESVRLIPWVYSVNQGYVLEFGHRYIRFYTEGGIVTVDGEPYELESPYEYDDVLNLKFVQSADTMYLVHPLYPPYQLVRYGRADWEIQPFELYFGPFLDENEDETVTVVPSDTEGEGITVTISGSSFVPEQAGALWQIKGPKYVEKSIKTDNTYTDPIEVLEGETVTLLVNGTWAGKITVQKSYNEGANWADYVYTEYNTAYDITETTDNNTLYRAGFKSGDRTSGTAEVRLELSDYRGYMIIDSVVSGTLVSGTDNEYTQVSGTVVEPFPSTDETYKWSEGAFSNFSGFPNSVGFYEQRLIFGGTPYRPQTVYGSKVDDYNNFKVGDLDNDSWTYTIASTSVNDIQWLLDNRVLFAGTQAAEWRIGRSDSPITPTSVDVKRQTSYGSNYLQAFNIGHSIIFVERGSRVLRGLIYDLRIDGWKSPSLSDKAEHLFEDDIVDMAYTSRPLPIIWLVIGDGSLVSCTFDLTNETVAYAKHTTEGYFESVAAIPGQDRDELWCVIRRTINSVETRYIEQLQTMEWDNQEDAIYLDSALTYDGDPTTTLSGAEHLALEEVSVLVDGANHHTVTVDENGAVTLDSPASKVHIGLPYTSYITPTKPEMVGPGGSIRGERKKIGKVVISVKDTLNLQVGPSLDDLKAVPFGPDKHDTAPPVYTGDLRIDNHGGFDTDGYITIASTTPTPFTLVAITNTIYTGGA